MRSCGELAVHEPRGKQRIALQVDRLPFAGRRDAHVADQHGRQDAPDLDEQPEVSTGDARDRGDRLRVGEVRIVEREAEAASCWSARR